MFELKNLFLRNMQEYNWKKKRQKNVLTVNEQSVHIPEVSLKRYQWRNVLKCEQKSMLKWILQNISKPFFSIS